MEHIVGSGKLEKTRLGVTLLEQEAWRAQKHQVDQALRVYCYSCIPTNFLADHFVALRVAERFFAEFFGFLFDNTCLCYLVFASLFLTLFLLVATMFVIYSGLECFANLGIAYIYHSAHQLFEYKLALVIL